MKLSCINSYMYADDLILLSISLNYMQRMIDLCCIVINSIYMKINFKKSNQIRIGPSFNHAHTQILLYNEKLNKSKDLKYLDIVILTNNTFTVNRQPFRQKLFGAMNGIFSKVDIFTSPVVLCSLIESLCLPILL